MPILLPWSLFEAVHDLEVSSVDGPQHCSCEFGQTSPSDFESFPFLQTPPWSCQRGHQRPKPPDALKDNLEQSPGNDHLRHLERDVSRMGDNLRANLDQLLP